MCRACAPASNALAEPAVIHCDVVEEHHRWRLARHDQSRRVSASTYLNVANVANWLRSPRPKLRPLRRRQAADLRFCVELRGIEPLTSSMPCTRRTVQHVRRRPPEATRVRSSPTAVQRRNRTGKTSSVQCVPTGPSPSLPVPPRPSDRQWLRCWLRRRNPARSPAAAGDARTNPGTHRHIPAHAPGQ